MTERPTQVHHHAMPLQRQGSVQSASSAGQTHMREYALVDAKNFALERISTIHSLLLRHALLTWVGLPVFVVILLTQELVISADLPFLSVSCQSGYPDWTLLVLLGLEVHHVWVESQIWACLRDLLTPPERTIMSQLGVLRQRRRMVMLGILEEIDLYTDLSFPLIARACDVILTAHWKLAWMEVPVIGKQAAALIHVLRFWGVASILSIFNVVVTGFRGIMMMQSDLAPSDPDVSNLLDAQDGVTGHAFFAWAKAAEVAMMPSVARLCDEMAIQRRYVFDVTKDAGDAHQARQDMALGKCSYKEAMIAEQVNSEAVKESTKQERSYFISVLFIKVFLGNMLQLWLQASFFSLTFLSTGPEAKYKVIASLVISGLQAIARVWNSLGRLGPQGMAILVVILMFIGLIVAKVKMAFKCPDHLWNLTTGCVEL